MSDQPENRPIIRLEKLSKDYQVGAGVVHALRDVDLAINRGEFVAVMGPSGSGKSTCMNLLGCLDSPSDGRYFLDGMDVAGLSGDDLARIRNEKIGFVFQSFNLLPRSTALHNVALPLVYSPRRRTQEDRNKLAAEVLETVGLAERGHHLPSQLSGGQMQRVAVARALVNHPVLLLADEPTGALDTRTGLEIMALFQTLNAQGITIVLVTHEPEISRFARRVVRFRDGRMESDESVEQPSDATQEMNNFSERVVS